MSYTDATKVSNYLGRALTAYETSAITDILAGVDKWIDLKLNSHFAQVDASTRFYDGGVKNLDIDPCTDITEVSALNDDTTESYTYQLVVTPQVGTPEVIAEPQNETVKRELRRRYGRFPRGISRIAVTAKFSEYDGGVPGDIITMATRLVAGVLNGGTTTGTGDVKSESLEGHQITYNYGDNSSALDGIVAGEETIKSILDNRRELFVDNSGVEGDDEETLL